MSKTSMVYRSIGQCGTKVSLFGLGGWTTFGDSVREQDSITMILRTAFDAGVNFFDTADGYAKGECERAMGRALAGLPRHELVISSKVFMKMSHDINDRGLSRKHIMESVEKSLQRLATDYLDIYFCHRYDESTPIEETVRAMDDLVRQGKIVYWGTSEWTGLRLRRVNRLCRARNLYRPQVEQPQYNLLERAGFEQDVRPAALRNGMGIVTWSPLASGMLSGKYDQGMPEGARLSRLDELRNHVLTGENRSRIVKFKEIADDVGCTRSQLALAWTAAQKGVSSVILGVTRLEQLLENLGALGVVITPEIRRRIGVLFPPAGLYKNARLWARRVVKGE